MDVEGAELDLLDPERVPGLRDAEIVVELHDHLVPGIGETLGRRSAPTHEVQLVLGEQSRLEQFPLSGWLWRTPPGRALALEAMQERRPERQDWLRLRRRAVSGRDSA